VQVSGYINHERKKAKDVLAYNQQHLIKLWTLTKNRGDVGGSMLLWYLSVVQWV
jgi:hypothetical protein